MNYKDIQPSSDIGRGKPGPSKEDNHHIWTASMLGKLLEQFVASAMSWPSFMYRLRGYNMAYLKEAVADARRQEDQIVENIYAAVVEIEETVLRRADMNIRKEAIRASVERELRGLEAYLEKRKALEG